MTREIFIEASPEETRVVVREGGKAVEIRVERATARSLAGSVFLARVDRVIPGMQCAFLDAGLSRHAFLHAADLLTEEADAPAGSEDAPERRRLAAVPKIQDVLRPGQEIVVQVTREPLGGKGARVTMNVTLPGKLLVYLPLSRQIGISRRIASEEVRASLRSALETLQDSCPGGAIVRTDAAGAPAEALRAEMTRLAQDWRDLLAVAARASAPALLREDEGLAARILRDAQAADVTRVVVNDAGLHERLAAWMALRVPALADRLELHAGPTGLFESAGIEQEIDRALRERVWLKSGGTIVINQLEALVAVDVNTGKFTGGTRQDETLLQVNLEAAREIARQLRLRDLGGIVVADFIDMVDPAHRQAVMDELTTALAADRAKTTVLPMSDFGIVQITRQRTGPSLDRVLLEPCADCGGTGRVRSVETVAHGILRRLRQAPPEARTLRAHPEVARFVSAALAACDDDMAGRKLTIVEDPALHRDAFEITS